MTYREEPLYLRHDVQIEDVPVATPVSASGDGTGARVRVGPAVLLIQRDVIHRLVDLRVRPLRWSQICEIVPMPDRDLDVYRSFFTPDAPTR